MQKSLKVEGRKEGKSFQIFTFTEAQINCRRDKERGRKEKTQCSEDSLGPRRAWAGRSVFWGCPHPYP